MLQNMIGLIVAQNTGERSININCLSHVLKKIDLLTEIVLEVVALDREFYNGCNREN